MTTEPLRIGVLGAARIAGTAIAAPARTTGHRLVAVAARDRSRAADFAAERVLDSYTAAAIPRRIPVHTGPYPPSANRGCRRSTTAGTDLSPNLAPLLPPVPSVIVDTPHACACQTGRRSQA